jgi:RHS repeat-associated protein
MIDSGANIVARYDYDPYGRRTKTSGSMDADFGFTGYYMHQPSGLQMALYRAYDADSGTFINRDPIGEAGGLNLFDYVGNDPIDWIDSCGLWTFGFGVQGSYGFAGGGAAIQVGFYFGRNPDTGKWSGGFLFGPAAGGGGPASVGGGGFVQWTSAKCVGQLKGLGGQTGGSGGEGMSLGGDAVYGSGYGGGQFNFGTSVGVPWEAHSYGTLTAGFDSDRRWK